MSIASNVAMIYGLLLTNNAGACDGLGLPIKTLYVCKRCRYKTFLRLLWTKFVHVIEFSLAVRQLQHLFCSKERFAKKNPFFWLQQSHLLTHIKFGI